MGFKRYFFTFYILLNCIFSFGQTAPLAGDVLFTHVDADADKFEFITLKRLNLTSLRFSDNGICTSGIFRNTEDTFGLTQFNQIADVPAGTIIRIVRDTSTTDTQDFNSEDGIITILISTLQFATGGDQIITYSGTPAMGTSACIGSGTNNFISGIDWGNTSGWNTGANSANNSKAPGTITDYAATNALDAAWFNGSVVGTISQIISTSSTGVRNSSNWNGTNTGTGTFLPLKNILFHNSDYLSGSISVSLGLPTTATLNLSDLQFSNTNSDSRYLITMFENTAPSLPSNRYTCYAPSTNYITAPAVVTSLTTPPCGGSVVGSGKIVYLGYSLPTNLLITSLNNNSCYYLKVYAINGNGYSSKLSDNPYSFNFYTGTISTSIQAY
jgi:hypothetical protein